MIKMILVGLSGGILGIMVGLMGIAMFVGVL